MVLRKEYEMMKWVKVLVFVVIFMMICLLLRLITIPPTGYNVYTDGRGHWYCGAKSPTFISEYSMWRCKAILDGRLHKRMYDCGPMEIEK